MRTSRRAGSRSPAPEPCLGGQQSCPALPAPEDDSLRRRLRPLRGRWRRLTARARVLPDFVIVGAQKAGTTSLYAYLAANDHVLPAASKEVHFLDTCAWNEGSLAYRANFPLRAHVWLATRLRGRRVITGEATPYYLYHPLGAERLAATAPDAKIIVLLRNPVERALSHYGHEVRGGRETLPLGKALEAEEERLRGHAEALVAGGAPCRHLEYRDHSYVDRGRYARQVASFLELFPGRVLVLQSERLFSDDPETKARLAEFLGLPPLTVPFVAENVGARKPRDPEEEAARRTLAAAFADEEEDLKRLLGQDFDWRSGTTAGRTGS